MDSEPARTGSGPAVCETRTAPLKPKPGLSGPPASAVLLTAVEQSFRYISIMTPGLFIWIQPTSSGATVSEQLFASEWIFWLGIRFLQAESQDDEILSTWRVAAPLTPDLTQIWVPQPSRFSKAGSREFQNVSGAGSSSPAAAQVRKSSAKADQFFLSPNNLFC